ncbi:MAG: hypothetical protein EPN69_05000 [Rhodanobacter sp.]|nr:MAG: hypothetical protein EPN69_05000 [Rhodanobacter sp.]TAL99582.1 MAG: hypothetical protein EPN71_07435 [Rhodanobacter sp.]TAM41795.1 MAG: hypothetical protein EPN58_05350 [Rhodanobacter sp.]TAN23245.1 MAG: hypothetical protein EPN32_12200 [Rhodanobacter sp.]
MSTPAHVPWCERISSALPFLVVCALAIVGGGALAAAMAHAPSRKLMWAVAYLVLVVGVTQAALGVGQALPQPGSLSLSPARGLPWGAPR